jgi:hypothetical protein
MPPGEKKKKSKGTYHVSWSKWGNMFIYTKKTTESLTQNYLLWEKQKCVGKKQS